VSRLNAQPASEHLDALKAEVIRRWGVVGLLDVLTEADWLTGFHTEFATIVLCLRILQAALVYINTLMLQDVLADPEWAKLLKPADQRGLTPLFWQHVQPYGEVRLDVAKRLPLGGSATLVHDRAVSDARGPGRPLSGTGAGLPSQVGAR
jgi:Tn3 transposase DDE domain